MLATFLFPIVARTAEQVTIGEQSLTIPLTEGFSRFDGISAALDEGLQKSLPPSKRLLMAVLPSDAVATAKTGKRPTLDRYMLIETMRAIEGAGITPAQFAVLSSNAEKTFSASTGKTGEFETAANKQFEAVTPDRKIMGTSPMGIYGKTPTWIDYGVLTNVSSRKDSKGVVAAFSSMIVRGKLINLQVYSLFRTDLDATWTRDTVKAWRESITSANP